MVISISMIKKHSVLDAVEENELWKDEKKPVENDENILI